MNGSGCARVKAGGEGDLRVEVIWYGLIAVIYTRVLSEGKRAGAGRIGGREG